MVSKDSWANDRKPLIAMHLEAGVTKLGVALCFTTVSFCALCGCSGSKHEPTQVDRHHEPCTPEDEAVFTLLIESAESNKQDTRHPRLLLNLATGKSVTAADQWSHLPPKQRPSFETIASFNELVGHSCSIAQPPNSGGILRLISQDELAPLFQAGVAAGWKAFYKKYPGFDGYTEFSAVGYNPKRDEALVHIEGHCAPLCSVGSIALLRKKNTEGKTVATVLEWIS